MAFPLKGSFVVKFTAGKYKVQFDYDKVRVDVIGNVPSIATNPQPDASIVGHTMITTIEISPSK